MGIYRTVRGKRASTASVIKLATTRIEKGGITGPMKVVVTRNKRNGPPLTPYKNPLLLTAPQVLRVERKHNQFECRKPNRYFVYFLPLDYGFNLLVTAEVESHFTESKSNGNLVKNLSQASATPVDHLCLRRSKSISFLHCHD